MPLMPTIDTSGISEAFGALAGFADNMAKRAESTRVTQANAELLKFESDTIRSIKRDEPNPEKWADLYQKKMDDFASSKVNSFGFVDTADQFKSSVSEFSAKRVQQLYLEADQQLALNADSDQTALMGSASNYDELYRIGKVTSDSSNFYLKQANGGSDAKMKLSTASKMVAIGSDIFQREVSEIGFVKAKENLDKFMELTSADGASVEDKAMANAFKKNIDPVIRAKFDEFSSSNLTDKLSTYSNLINGHLLNGDSKSANSLVMSVNSRIANDEFDKIMTPEDQLKLRLGLSNSLSGTKDAVSAQALSGLMRALYEANSSSEQTRTKIFSQYIPLLNGDDFKKGEDAVKSTPVMNRTIHDYSQMGKSAIFGAFGVKDNPSSPQELKDASEASAALKQFTERVTVEVFGNKGKNISVEQQNKQIQGILNAIIAPKINSSFSSLLGNVKVSKEGIVTGKSGKVSDTVGGYTPVIPESDKLVYKMASGELLFQKEGLYDTESEQLGQYGYRVAQAMLEAKLHQNVILVGSSTGSSGTGDDYRLLYKVVDNGQLPKPAKDIYYAILPGDANSSELLYQQMDVSGKTISKAQKSKPQSLKGTDWTIGQ